MSHKQRTLTLTTASVACIGALGGAELAARAMEPFRPDRFTLLRRATYERFFVLIGDSFAYGWLVDDTETIGAYVEQELGPDTEVVNLGVRGHGLDQMALAATEIAPAYRPAFVIIAFIGDDLSKRPACPGMPRGRRRRPGAAMLDWSVDGDARSRGATRRFGLRLFAFPSG